MHEGTIRVNSTLGEGSEFIIELPVVLTNDISEAIEEISDIYVIK
ncbi:hypothetical protein EDD79_1001255 [Serpentinicella alkaliphila]|uniref:Histidine kinase/DNA gyrase B/HSP90-like ATPase n=1 Tax=Serpentinicella alkaliphila TaxID=1734049 RepID=A0A4R2TY38_9FIRM|nr:hypothetical protein EDD79_1001255 [Serpentinicella alkaliphila]